MAGWMAGWRGECPKFHVLEYNYSIFAGQRVAIFSFKPATFNNSKIWDIDPLGAPMRAGFAEITRAGFAER